MLVVFFETVNRGVRPRPFADALAAIAVRLPPCEKFVVSPATRALP
jgi:hypothetical protein